MASSTENDVVALRKLIAETYPSFVMAHDAAGYADLYAGDVLWAPPNGPDQTSREGVKNRIQGRFDKFAFQVDVQPEEIDVLGDFAYVIGSVDGVRSPRDGSAPVTIRFRVFWLLRREVAGWRITRQIWNNKPVGTDIPVWTLAGEARGMQPDLRSSIPHQPVPGQWGGGGGTR